MRLISTTIEGVVLIEPQIFEDPRGLFMETFHSEKFLNLGLPDVFVQDNQSRSALGVVRGLHYQIERPQGKLVRAIRGTIFDVAVDLRRSSPTFGESVSMLLSADNCRQLYIPAGCAHGFCALSEGAEVVYKCTRLYSPQHERTLLWNDPHLRIDWPIDDPILSEKDRRGLTWENAPFYEAELCFTARGD